MYNLNQNQLIKIEECLEDFKCLLVRHRQIKNDEYKLKLFYSRNRNPFWDITNIKLFKTGLYSEEAKKMNEKLVDDHYIQRSKAMAFFFDELEKNPKMDLYTFINFLIKYCSTVKITETENKKVTNFARKNRSFKNYEIYLACDIKINGLSDIISK